MIKKRPANARGKTDLGWLRSFHTFSFGDYRDPEHSGFCRLRVINEDRVEAARGFGAHPHRDMEIFSYVVSGALEHKDSLGNGSVIRSGDVQVMTAGTGVLHSEFNPSPDEPVHFLQIWILPRERGLKPRWEQKRFQPEWRDNELLRIIGPEGDGNAHTATLAQDAHVYTARLKTGKTVTHPIHPGHGVWLQVIEGKLAVGEIALSTGDGAAIEEEAEIRIEATADAHFLLIDTV